MPRPRRADHRSIPLHDAICHGHLDAARVYLEVGTRTDLRGLDGRTPLQLARDYGYSELADLLAEY